MNAESPPKNSDPCSDCDLEAVEDQACSAKRFQKQADVANESLAQLTEFKTKFGTARNDYQAARDAAQADIAAARTQLKDVLGQLRCRLDDHTEECLKDARDKVVDQIRECAGEPGCCVGECEFDSSPGDDDAAALSGRIERYRREVKKASECFKSLIAEQAALPVRAKALRDAVAAIAAEVAAENPAKDWARLYARALVARWQLRKEQLWQGFPTVNAYVDCLCAALTCALKGWEAIAILEGTKAEMDCKAEAADAACKKKQENIVDEVMREYVCLCPPDDDDDDDDYPPRDDDKGHGPGQHDPHQSAG
jgi:hypothetical protein